MEAEKMRAILVRHKARLFANEVKKCYGFALAVPSDTIDWLKDEEIEPFKAHLVEFGLRQRNIDFKWEKA